MFRSMKYLGTPVVLSSLFMPVAYAKEADPRCTSNPSDVYKQPAPRCRKQLDESTELEKCIQSCRKELKPIKEGITGFVSDVSNFFRDTSTTIGKNVDYLRSAPQEVQVGTIVAGTVIGSLLGFRRGLVRKIWYGSLGGLGTAAVIYPEEAKIVARNGFQLAKCYSTIAYNFIAGRKEN